MIARLLRKYIWGVTICFFLLGFVVFSVAWAQTSFSTQIDARVKVSLCGDGAAEGPEDCDDTDLGGNNCGTVGYTIGMLSCLPDCSFDTSLCVFIPTPTPTPTNTPTPTQTPPPVPTSTILPTPTGVPVSVSTTQAESSPTQEQQSERSIPDAIVQTLQEVIVRVVREDAPGTASIPPFILRFTQEAERKLTFDELLGAVRTWAAEWRAHRLNPLETQACDLNSDAVCNLQDFSIVLYYHEPT